jgi:hypothetical protein
MRWLGEYSLPILLHKGLDNEVIGIPLGDALVDFLQHSESGIARPGERATDVVATTGGIVAPAAHAFHFHAQLVRVIELLCIPKPTQKRQRTGKTQRDGQNEQTGPSYLSQFSHGLL